MTRTEQARWASRRARPSASATVAGLLLALAGCATTTSSLSTGPETAEAARRAAEEAWGIRVGALRRSAAGYVLDFRYRVTDAARAAPFLDGKKHPYLVDGRGARLGVPDSPKLGSLRQTSRNGKVSTTHDYFMLFANPARYLKPGDRVTLVVGDAKVPDLVVE